MKKFAVLGISICFLLFSAACGGLPADRRGGSNASSAAAPASGESAPAPACAEMSLPADISPSVAELSVAEGPDKDWAFDVPENHNMDHAIFSALHTALEGTQVNAMLTVKDGVVVDEFYQGDFDESSVFRFNSCSKGNTGWRKRN